MSFLVSLCLISTSSSDLSSFSASSLLGIKSDGNEVYSLPLLFDVFDLRQLEKKSVCSLTKESRGKNSARDRTRFIPLSVNLILSERCHFVFTSFCYSCLASKCALTFVTVFVETFL